MSNEETRKELTRFGICFIINENQVWLSPGDLVRVGDISEDAGAFLEMDEYGYFIFSIGYERDFNDYPDFSS